MLGLIITAMVVGVISMFVPTLRQQNALSNGRNTNWQRLLFKLEAQERPISWVKIKDNGKTLEIVRPMLKRSSLNVYLIHKTQKTNTLYMGGLNGGFMPLLREVKHVEFTEYQQHIVMDVTFLDGDQKKAVLAIDKATEKTASEVDSPKLLQ